METRKSRSGSPPQSRSQSGRQSQSRSWADKGRLATAVSRGVDIDSIVLVGSTVRRKDFRQACLPPEVRLGVGSAAQVDVGKSKLVVQLGCLLAARYEDAGPQDYVLTIEATYHLIYSITTITGLTQAHYDAFAESNAVFNAWPYWREYVQNVLSRMGLPPLTIPTLKLDSGHPKIRGKGAGIGRRAVKRRG